MPALRGRPMICIDFDGVVHDYKAGWQGGEIYGSLVPGFFAWAMEASQQFQLTIYSSRSKEPQGIVMMQSWMRNQLIAQLMPPHEIEEFLNILQFAHEKPAAWITIDDRAICFKGDWTAPELQPAALMDFLPWMVQRKTPE
jgi:hypothetical protein